MNPSNKHITLATLLQIGSTQRELGLWIDILADKTYTPEEVRTLVTRLKIASARKEKYFTRLIEWESAQKKIISMLGRGGDILLSSDQDFPEALKLADHLHLFWLRGDRALLGRDMMSVVGTRNASPYTKKAFDDIIP